MFRTVLCSSSGGQIVLLQPLVSSLSVNGRTVRQLRADSVRSQPAYCTAIFKEVHYTGYTHRNITEVLTNDRYEV